MSQDRSATLNDVARLGEKPQEINGLLRNIVQLRSSVSEVF